MKLDMGLALLAGVLVMAAMLAACRIDTNVSSAAPGPNATLRWLSLAETAPHGSGNGTRSRVVSTLADGTKTWVLVLAAGDDVNMALLTFAKKEIVHNAHFVAIGGVRAPEVGWYDLGRKQYKAMAIGEQVEVLTLSGDIALAPSGEPSVHIHGVFGRSDGSAWGGHVLHATVSPMLEVYLTAYPSPLSKKHDDINGLDRIEP